MTEPMSRERSARAGVMLAAMLNVVGVAFDAVAGLDVRGVPEWPSALSGCVGLVVLAVVLRVPDPSTRTISALFLVNTLAVVGALWLRDRGYAMSGLSWAPYQANKLGCVIVAFLAPGRRVGTFAIVAHAGSSLLSLVLLPPDIRARIQIGEPTATLAFGAASVALLVHRLNSQELAARLAQVEAERRWMAQHGRALAAIRDLANTPLQTLVLCTELIRRQTPPEIAPLLARIDRAIARLREIEGILSRYDPGYSDARRLPSLDVALSQAVERAIAAERQRTTRGAPSRGPA